MTHSMAKMRRKKKNTTKVSKMAGRDPSIAVMIFFNAGRRLATLRGRRIRRVFRPLSADAPDDSWEIHPSTTTTLQQARLSEARSTSTTLFVEQLISTIEGTAGYTQGAAALRLDSLSPNV
jgi:hypothetical protein